MSAALDDFIAEARDVTIADAAARLKLGFKPRGAEHPQPCPACGGVDRFSFNTAKNKWHCRGDGIGGQDAIGMAAHVLELDLHDRAGFLEACSAVLDRDIPEGGERESEEDRAARLARIEERKKKSAAEAERRERGQADFRERERKKARGIYEAAAWVEPHDTAISYLRARGCGLPNGRWLRFSAEQTYWHGQDERGQLLALHVGPAMIAPFISLTGRAAPVGADPARARATRRDGPSSHHLAPLPPLADGWEIVGCHITWVDLANPPKFRPRLVDPATGEILPTKKMRGTKKGGLIPLAGDPSAGRWLGAEGIENTLAFARWEDFRADTFYFAAGDLGNMAGPADPKSRFAHPTLKKRDRNGRERPVMVAGPVPHVREGDEPDAMVVPDHVDELVLLADADSERVMTASAMVRARARHARPGRLIPVVWPAPGTDFAALMADSDEAYQTGAKPAWNDEPIGFLVEEVSPHASKNKRKRVSDSLWFRVLHRDGYRCRYCGVSSKDARLVCDHVVPVKAGGATTEDNLVAACQRCNSGKGARILQVAP